MCSGVLGSTGRDLGSDAQHLLTQKELSALLSCSLLLQRGVARPTHAADLGFLHHPGRWPAVRWAGPRLGAHSPRPLSYLRDGGGRSGGERAKGNEESGRAMCGLSL